MATELRQDTHAHLYTHIHKHTCTNKMNTFDTFRNHGSSAHAYSILYIILHQESSGNLFGLFEVGGDRAEKHYFLISTGIQKK